MAFDHGAPSLATTERRANAAVRVTVIVGFGGLGDNGRMSGLDAALTAQLKRDADGLIAAVVQEHDTGDVLMLAWMDDEALHRTLTTGRATYWSRSRKEIWVKGETSGHRQRVREVRLDCDGDAILLKVDQQGPACHTGTRTCFDDGLLSAATEGAS